MRLWPLPIDYNWRGQRLVLAHIGQEFELKPFGPQNHHRARGVVSMVNEERQLVAVSDRRQSVILTFEEWQYMQPEAVPLRYYSPIRN